MPQTAAERWADNDMGKSILDFQGPGVTQTNPDDDATASGGQVTPVDAELTGPAHLTAALVSESDAGAVFQGEDRGGSYVTVSLPTAEFEALGSPQSVVVTGGDFE